MNLKLNSTSQEVMRAVEALQRFGESRGIPERTLFGIALALEEIGSNIVNHAYHNDGREIFTVHLDHQGDRLIVETRDHGPAFNPLLAPPPSVNLDSDNLALGGAGISLVRHYMDQLDYAREGDENVLRMTKLLSPRTFPDAKPSTTD